jgi:hypothetical protein
MLVPIQQVAFEPAAPVTRINASGAFEVAIERTPEDWNPRNPRKPASTTGVAYRSDGSWMRVHMTNLSYDGCKILTEDRLDIGETLKLVMPRMQHMEVQVRWVKEQEAGVRFLGGGSVIDERRARLGI